MRALHRPLRALTSASVTALLAFTVAAGVAPSAHAESEYDDAGSRSELPRPLGEQEAPTPEDPAPSTESAAPSSEAEVPTLRRAAVESSPTPTTSPAPAASPAPSTSPTPRSSASQASPALKTLVTSGPRISGSAVVGETLAANAGQWTPGARLRYQWFADGTAISGATSRTFTIAAAQRGRQISVRVTGQAAGFTTAERNSSRTSRVAQASTPRITGAVRTGVTLTAVPGAWTSGTAFSYQWRANGTVIRGATKRTYKVPESRQGQRISVSVTGTKSGHTRVTRTSANTSQLLRTAGVRVSGSAVTGQRLTAVTGTWSSGTRLSYQWQADGRNIRGATKRTYTIGTGQQGKRISVVVTGRKSSHASASRASSATSRVMRASTPRISGTAQVNRTLTAASGTWSPQTRFTYQWRSNGKNIRGATSRTYKISSGQQGKKITVAVTGRKSGHTTVTRVSAATSTVARAAAARSSSGGGSSTPASRPAVRGTWNCPSGFPVKGNRNSRGEWIYHVRGGQFYDRTNPEECFRTEAGARAAGYRKSKL